VNFGERREENEYRERMKERKYDEGVSLLNPKAHVQLVTHNALRDLRPSLVVFLGNNVQFMQFNAKFHTFIMQTMHNYEAPRRQAIEIRVSCHIIVLTVC
jgi:hypothetical protein